MTTRRQFHRSRLLAAIAALAMGLPVAVQAQDEPLPEDGPAITVEAPRKLPQRVDRSPYTGATTVVSTLSIPVLYGDLDLSSDADVARLMTRIDRVAHDACRQLDVLYPLVSDPDCIGNARANGEAAAKDLLEAMRSAVDTAADAAEAAAAE